VTKDPNLRAEINLKESELQEVTTKNARDFADIVKDVQDGGAFAKEVSKEPNDEKVIAMLNEDDDDIKKSLIFSFNVEKL
jgi:hypothetical protein